MRGWSGGDEWSVRGGVAKGRGSGFSYARGGMGMLGQVSAWAWLPLG